MKVFLKRLFIVLAVVAPVSACETPDPVQVFPSPTYGHLGVFNLNVGAIDIKNEYQAPLAAPSVDHRFPTPPQKALEQWAKDRLKAAGAKGSARFTILQAGVREAPLQLKKGIVGVFTQEQSVRYEATLEATLEVLDGRGYRQGFATARVSRSRTLEEGATVNERDRMWFEMTEMLMQDFNAEMEKNIRAHLGGFLM